MHYAFAYAQSHAMMLESSYPYEARNANCRAKAGVTRLSGWAMVPAGSDAALASAVNR